MEKADPFEFVKKLEQLLGNYDLSTDQDYLKEILIPKPKNRELELTGEFLYDLYNHFELSGRTIGFDFLECLNENSDYIFFAIEDPFYIGINKKSKEIIMFDLEYHQEHLKISQDINQFEEVILLIFEYGLSGWISNKQYSKEDKFSLLTKIKQIIDSKYLKYYEQSYGS